ncbi:MAG: hypothetical protein GX601_02605 [Anaerolineales bacterium]|nr:hypothetical protein [Anaerolineales bacterium]
MKIACILCQHLPVQFERRKTPALAHTPLIVGGRPWDAGAVLDCCARACEAGVRNGMRLAQAETICPGASFVPAHHEDYQVAHDLITAEGYRLTDRIETAELGMIYVNVTGLERRFGSDQEIADLLAAEASHAVGLDVRAGVANGKFVAQQAACAARPSTGCVVQPGQERAFLSPLPLSTLPADVEMERRLVMLGIRSLGALAALPRLAIVRQFGAAAGPLHDLASGIDPRPIERRAPPLQLRQQRTFEPALETLEPLLANTDVMARELATTMLHSGYQAEGLRLQVESATGVTREAATSVKPASADSAKLARLARSLLGRATAADPIEAMTLLAYPVRPFHLGATQLTLFDDAHDARREQLHAVIRRLRQRFGDLVIVLASLIGPPPPQPIQVMTTPSGLPCSIVWRDHIHKVVDIYESWRIRTCWWRKPVERDYFRIETPHDHVMVVFHDLRSDQWMLEHPRI